VKERQPLDTLYACFRRTFGDTLVPTFHRIFEQREHKLFPALYFLALHAFGLERIRLIKESQTSRDKMRETKNSRVEEREIPPSSIAVTICIQSRMVILC